MPNTRPPVAGPRRAVDRGQVPGGGGVPRRDHPPVHPQLALDTATVRVGVAIADDDPLLVGRRPVPQCPHGQRLNRPGSPRIRPAAGLLVGVPVHRAVDRDGVPPQHLHARAEMFVVVDQGGVRRDARHQIARSGRRPAHLNGERQHGRPSLQRRRAEVAGVRVAQLGQHAGNLGMEGQRVEHVAALPQQPQPLHRIDAVRRALQRQMRVQPVDQTEEHIHDRAALIGIHRSKHARPAGQEPGQPLTMLRCADRASPVHHDDFLAPRSYRNAAARPSSAPPWKPRPRIDCSHDGL